MSRIQDLVSFDWATVLTVLAWTFLLAFVALVVGGLVRGVDIEVRR